MDILRLLPTDQYNAALNANAPTSLNPFATIADLSGLSDNIYNADGSLTANRILTGAGFDLTMTGLGILALDASTLLTIQTSGAATIGISATGTGNVDISSVGGSVRLNNLRYPTADGSANFVLKTDGATNLSFVDINTLLPAAPTTLYSGDGTISSDRIMTLGGFGFRIRKDGTASSFVTEAAGKVGLGSVSAAGNPSYDVHMQGQVVIGDGANGNYGTLTMGGGGTPNAQTLIRLLIPPVATTNGLTGIYIQQRNLTNSSKGIQIEMRNAGTALSYGVQVNGGTNAEKAVTHRSFYATSSSFGNVNTIEYGLSADLFGGSSTVYGVHSRARSTSATVTNYAGWFEATDGLNNHALVTNGGNVGFGTTTPNANSMVQITPGALAHLLLTPITAATASAITATNGMIVCVSDTDATFTSVGFWGYEGGAWTKL